MLVPTILDMSSIRPTQKPQLIIIQLPPAHETMTYFCYYWPARWLVNMAAHISYSTATAKCNSHWHTQFARVGEAAKG